MALMHDPMSTYATALGCDEEELLRRVAKAARAGHFTPMEQTVIEQALQARFEVGTKAQRQVARMRGVDGE